MQRTKSMVKHLVDFPSQAISDRTRSRPLLNRQSETLDRLEIRNASWKRETEVIESEREGSQG